MEGAISYTLRPPYPWRKGPQWAGVCVGLRNALQAVESTGSPIKLGRCPSLSAHESESMLRTHLVCRDKQERERERERQANGTWDKHTVY
jgi:hypothetical protein